MYSREERMKVSGVFKIHRPHDLRILYEDKVLFHHALLLAFPRPDHAIDRPGKASPASGN